MNMTDFELLNEYARTRRQDLFAQLVARHVDWVHSVALRRVHDTHMAEDITQAVFLALAQNAAKLPHNTVLSAWLFGVTRCASLTAIRQEKRRRSREKEAAMIAATSQPTAAEWEQMALVLDELVARLSTPDRQAILLRFYQRQTLAEMAAALGATDEAARKRVSRALDRLRVMFARRGVPIPAAALGTTLLANAAHTASPALAHSAAAIATTAGNAQILMIAKGALTMIAIAKAKLVVVCAIAVLAAVPLALLVHHALAANPQPPARPAPAASTTRPSDNAATLYRQAFAIISENNLGAAIPDARDTTSTDPATSHLLQRAQPVTQLLHRAADMKSADWTMVYNAEGLAQFMSDLSQARTLSRLAAVRARYLFAQGQTPQAADELLAIIALARHLSAEPIVVGRMSAVGIETLAITQAAEHLPRFSRQSLDDFPARLQRLPAMHSLKQVVQGEKKYAMATFSNVPGVGATGTFRAFYDGMADAVIAPPDQFDKAWATMQQQASAAGPFATIILPAMLRVRQNDDRLSALRAMLFAAITVQRDGEAALKTAKDPFADGPFTCRKLPAGFELQSKLKINNKPATLTVGPPPTNGDK